MNNLVKLAQLFFALRQQNNEPIPIIRKIQLPTSIEKITRLVRDSQEQMINISNDIIKNLGSRVRKLSKQLPDECKAQIRRHPLFVSPGAKAIDVLRDNIEIVIIWKVGKQNGKIVIPIEYADDIDSFFDYELSLLKKEVCKKNTSKQSLI